MAGNRHDDPYERALENPDFAAAVAAAHTGAWRLPDALWWEWHPEDPAPSGTPSPIATLRALQRRVFAADGDAAGDAVVAEAVRGLEAEIAAERLAIAEALRAANAQEIGASATVVASTFDELVGSAAGEDALEPEVVESDRAPQWLSGRFGRRHWLLAGGILLAVAIGVILGSQLGAAGLVSGAAPTPSGTPSPSPAASIATVSSESPSMIFLREQTPKDIPLVSTGTVFQADSFRYLGSADWSENPNEVGISPYYAALSTSHMTCLVAMPESGGYVSTCALESGFPSAGLRLYWESNAVMHSETGVSQVLGDFVVVWELDGGLSAEFRGRPTSSDVVAEG
ncbi:hypothetical protein [Cryobacterium arcticum]|uniref:hypothetical protein n=1 Tax=Cryobacterium arcticum TaxID=670052 RepID=UPI0008307D76|nr:hypothetical protein [Cryobacterium arcticum]